MVQAGTSNSYENGDQPGKPETDWTDIIRAAVSDFVQVVGESTNQLAGAAERYAGESQRAMEEAAVRARSHATTSSDMASAAGQAAAEARRAADLVTANAGQATEEARNAIEQVRLAAASANEGAKRAILEMNQTARDAAEQARAAVAALSQSSSEAVRAFSASATSAVESLNQSAAAAAQSVQQSAVVASDSVNQSASAAIETVNQSLSSASERLREDARIVAEQMKADVMFQTNEALEQIRQAASSNHQFLSDAQQAAQEARTAANDSKAHAERAQEVALSPTVGEGVQMVLERLEVDYQLIARLVQELHSRITSLTTPARIEPAPLKLEPNHIPNYEPVYEPSDELLDYKADAPQVEAPVIEAEAEPEPVAPVQPASAWYQSGRYDDEPAYEATPVAAVMEAMPVMTPPQVEEIPLPTVAGRVLVTIAPVPDFDRLLNLDGALGRMSGIANVSLADYAKEEVTFRLEIEKPMTVDDFARSLSESAGSAASVATSEEGKLALRLAS